MEKIDNFLKTIERLGIPKIVFSIIFSYILVVISPKSFIQFMSERFVDDKLNQALILFVFYFMIIFLIYDLIVTGAKNYFINREKIKKYNAILKDIHSNYDKQCIQILQKFFDKSVNQFIPSIELCPSDKNVELLTKMQVLHFNGPWTYYRNEEYEHKLNVDYLNTFNYHYKKTNEIVKGK